jgi:hypothetical protein
MFFGGDLNDYNQHYGDDELDRLHAAANEMDLHISGEDEGYLSP